VKYQKNFIKNEMLSKLSILSVHNSGEGFVCLTKDSKVYTWGWNEHGNLGTGDKIDRFEPQLVEEDCCSKIAVGGAYFFLYS